MEGVWLKTEPIDDSSNDCFTFKLEQGIAEPLTIIEQDESKTLHIKSDSASEDIDSIQKSDVKRGSKKSTHKTTKRQKGIATESDVETAEKKPATKKGRKPSTSAKMLHICDECGKEFRGSYDLNRHKLVHSDVRPYVCPEENCGAAFRQNSALKSHQMTHTGERTYFCEECGQGFSSKYHMQIHQRTKHGDECPFVCGECGQRFPRRKGLVKHELQHRGEKPFECDDCGMRFYEELLLRSHKKTHTVDGKPFTCAECGKGFYHKTSLNAHKRNHSTVRPFGCEICGKRFTQKGTLTIHKITHSDVRPFECEECGLRFTQKFTLKTHRLKQHGLSTTPKKPVNTFPITTDPNNQSNKILPNDNSEPSEPLEFSAPVGSSRISVVPLNIKDPIDYQRTNEIEGNTPASQNEPSSSDDDFTLAANEADEESTGFEDKFPVNIIVDSLHSQPINEMSTNLQQIKVEPRSSEPYLDIWKSERTTPDHEFVNVSEKRPKKEPAPKTPRDESVKLPFPCEKCDRTFALVSALKNHQRSHRPDKKERKKLSYICDECGKIFAGKQQLKIHKRVHSGLKPYPCTECDRKFSTRGGLTSHQVTHTEERPFACEICGMKFSMKKRLDRHKLVHTDVKNFECDVCGMKFRECGGLKRHKLTHTGERNYGCDICGKTFADKTYIKFHLRTHTGYKPVACDQCPSTFINKCQLKRHKAHSHRGVGEPSPYQRTKLRKMMRMMNNPQ